MMPDTANILLSHNPDSFDRGPELGIDFTLAERTYGGQLSLELAHRGLALAAVNSPTSRDGSTKPAATSTSTPALARSAFPSLRGKAGDYVIKKYMVAGNRRAFRQILVQPRAHRCTFTITNGTCAQAANGALYTEFTCDNRVGRLKGRD
jgi:hypothetical protein